MQLLIAHVGLQGFEQLCAVGAQYEGLATSHGVAARVCDTSGKPKPYCSNFVLWYFLFYSKSALHLRLPVTLLYRNAHTYQACLC